MAGITTLKEIKPSTGHAPVKEERRTSFLPPMLETTLKFLRGRSSKETTKVPEKEPTMVPASSQTDIQPTKVVEVVSSKAQTKLTSACVDNEPFFQPNL